MPCLQTAEVSPAVRVHLNPLDLTRADVLEGQSLE